MPAVAQGAWPAGRTVRMPGHTKPVVEPSTLFMDPVNLMRARQHLVGKSYGGLRAGATSTPRPPTAAMPVRQTLRTPHTSRELRPISSRPLRAVTPTPSTLSLIKKLPERYGEEYELYQIRRRKMRRTITKMLHGRVFQCLDDWASWTAERRSAESVMKFAKRWLSKTLLSRQRHLEAENVKWETFTSDVGAQMGAELDVRRRLLEDQRKLAAHPTDETIIVAAFHEDISQAEYDLEALRLKDERGVQVSQKDRQQCDVRHQRSTFFNQKFMEPEPEPEPVGKAAVGKAAQSKSAVLGKGRAKPVQKSIPEPEITPEEFCPGMPDAKARRHLWSIRVLLQGDNREHIAEYVDTITVDSPKIPGGSQTVLPGRDVMFTTVGNHSIPCELRIKWHPAIMKDDTIFHGLFKCKKPVEGGEPGEEEDVFQPVLVLDTKVAPHLKGTHVKFTEHFETPPVAHLKLARTKRIGSRSPVHTIRAAMRLGSMLNQSKQDKQRDSIAGRASKTTVHQAGVLLDTTDGVMLTLPPNAAGGFLDIGIFPLSDDELAFLNMFVKSYQGNMKVVGPSVSFTCSKDLSKPMQLWIPHCCNPGNDDLQLQVLCGSVDSNGVTIWAAADRHELDVHFSHISLKRTPSAGKVLFVPVWTQGSSVPQVLDEPLLQVRLFVLSDRAVDPTSSSTLCMLLLALDRPDALHVAMEMCLLKGMLLAGLSRTPVSLKRSSSLLKLRMGGISTAPLFETSWTPSTEDGDSTQQSESDSTELVRVLGEFHVPVPAVGDDENGSKRVAFVADVEVFPFGPTAPISTREMYPIPCAFQTNGLKSCSDRDVTIAIAKGNTGDLVNVTMKAKLLRNAQMRAFDWLQEKGSQVWDDVSHSYTFTKQLHQLHATPPEAAASPRSKRSSRKNGHGHGHGQLKGQEQKGKGIPVKVKGYGLETFRPWFAEDTAEESAGKDPPVWTQVHPLIRSALMALRVHIASAPFVTTLFRLLLCCPNLVLEPSEVTLGLATAKPSRSESGHFAVGFDDILHALILHRHDKTVQQAGLSLIHTSLLSKVLHTQQHHHITVHIPDSEICGILSCTMTALEFFGDDAAMVRVCEHIKASLVPVVRLRAIVSNQAKSCALRCEHHIAAQKAQLPVGNRKGKTGQATSVLARLFG